MIEKEEAPEEEQMDRLQEYQLRVADEVFLKYGIEMGELEALLNLGVNPEEEEQGKQ